MPKYKPRIGNEAVDFIEYYNGVVRNQQEYLAQTGREDVLPSPDQVFGEYMFTIRQPPATPKQAVEVAQYLRDQGWDIDLAPLEGRQVLEEASGLSVFDQYFNALKLENYELAHEIYESMTPSQQQVIRDRSRRGAMANRLRRLAQEEADTEAVLEKEVPVEQPGAGLLSKKPGRGEENMAEELLGGAQTILDQAYELQIPMQLALPLATALDHFRKASQDYDFKRISRDEYKKRLEEFFKAYNQVLNHLAPEHDVADQQGLLQEYADLYTYTGFRPTAARKMLALASKLHTEGKLSIARRLLKVIEAQEESLQTGEATEQAPLSRFKQLLVDEDYDGARKLYLELDPVDRRAADEVAKLHFAASTFVQLYTVGQSLFDKKHYAEATKINRMIRAQFLELPPEMQSQVILLIVPEGEDLPQAFKSTEDAEENTRKMEERVTDMRDRLLPELPGDVCNPHCSKIIPKLLRLADKLDAEGKVQLADRIDKWLQKATVKVAEEDGKPEKVVEIADAIRRDNPDTSDEAAYRMAWETYCSYTNRSHPGCTEKGKSMRKSPKPYEKSSSVKKAKESAKEKYVSEEGHFKGKEGSGERWDNCIKYQMSQGKSKESAEKICGYIKSRKGLSSKTTKKATVERK